MRFDAGRVARTALRPLHDRHLNLRDEMVILMIEQERLKLLGVQIYLSTANAHRWGVSSDLRRIN